MLFGNFGQGLLIRSCHEDVILTRKNHNCAGTAFVEGNSAGDSKLIEQTLPPPRAATWSNCQDPLVEVRPSFPGPTVDGT